MRARSARQLVEAGLRVELDLRNEKINYKVREHSLAKVPIMLVCGKREAEEGTVNIRRLGVKDQQSMALDAGAGDAAGRGGGAGRAAAKPRRGGLRQGHDDPRRGRRRDRAGPDVRSSPRS